MAIFGKSQEPTSMTLPKTNICIEVGVSLHHDLPHLMEFYIKLSPLDFFKQYLKIVLKKGDVEIEDLPDEDIKVIINVCLKKELKSAQLTGDETKDESLAFFRDNLVGVPYDKFIKEKNSLKEEFENKCDNFLHKVETLESQNKEGQKDTDHLASLHQKQKEHRQFRLKENLQHLESFGKRVSLMKSCPDLYILEALMYKGINKGDKFANSFRYLDLITYDPQYLEFPFRWCGFLPVDVFRKLYKDWLSGEDVTKDMIDSVQDEDNIGNIINTVIGNKHISEGRKERILEGFDCYKEGKYAPAITALLPQIEGLLWDLANFYNSRNKYIFKQTSENGAYLSPYYEVNREGNYKLKTGEKHYFDIKKSGLNSLILKVNKKGEILKLNYVTTLLEETALRFYIDVDLLEYLCGELFVERNDILHGRKLDFGTPENAAMKILAVHVVACEFD